MTLDTALSKALYQGNGSATQFPFAFKVWEPSQIHVIAQEGTDASVNVTADCTITLNDNGGVVTYAPGGEPLSSAWKLAIIRAMPFTQEIDLISGSRFDPQVMENGLDQAAAERQQLLEQLSRAVVLPPSSEQSPQEVVEDIYAARDEAQASAISAASSEAAAEKSASESVASANFAKEYKERSCQCADRAEQARDAALAQAEATNALMAAEMSKINAIVSTNKDDQQAAITGAKAWADSDMPPDPNDPESKSAKTWAEVAKDNVITNLPVASAAKAGIVKISSNINVTSEGEISVDNASTTAKGVVQLNNTITDTSTTQAATANAVNTLRKSVSNLCMPGTKVVQFASLGPDGYYTAPADGYFQVQGNAGENSWWIVSGEQDRHVESGNNYTLSRSFSVMMPIAKDKKMRIQNVNLSELYITFIYAIGAE